MLIVPTYIGPSPIHGTGTFAAAPIAAGATMWVFQPELDLIVPDGLVAQLPAPAQEFVRTYAFRSDYWPGGFVLCFDHSRFINHSATPNTDNRSEITVARRDIAAGEEITCDYGELDPGTAGVAWVPAGAP
jgi:uncharacterized protein